MKRYNIAYFAFDQFIPSQHAGFVHTFSIIKSLKELGNRIILYAIPSGAHLLNILKWQGEYEGIPINYTRFATSFKSKYRIFSFLNSISYPIVLKSIKKQSPEIIHERFCLPCKYSIKIYKKFKSAPKILEVNSLFVEEGIYPPKIAKIAKKQRREIFKLCNAIITQTETLKSQISKLTEKPVYVIPNGVDTKKFKANLNAKHLRKELNLKKDEIVVTFVGSFRKWHGVEKIPKIAKKFENKKVKFLLIGHGELFDYVKKIKTKNMILLGSRPHEEIPKYLAISDILIAPFNHDYFKNSEFWWNPVKLFEYMASGKPIVSYDYKEVRKIVRDSGLLAKPGNLNDFIKKLEYLIEDENLRRKMGRKARDIAVKEYDWKIRAKETMKVYEEVA